MGPLNTAPMVPTPGPRPLMALPAQPREGSCLWDLLTGTPFHLGSPMDSTNWCLQPGHWAPQQSHMPALPRSCHREASRRVMRQMSGQVPSGCTDTGTVPLPQEAVVGGRLSSCPRSRGMNGGTQVQADECAGQRGSGKYQRGQETWGGQTSQLFPQGGLCDLGPAPRGTCAPAPSPPHPT